MAQAKKTSTKQKSAAQSSRRPASGTARATPTKGTRGGIDPHRIGLNTTPPSGDESKKSAHKAVKLGSAGPGKKPAKKTHAPHTGGIQPGKTGGLR